VSLPALLPLLLLPHLLLTIMSMGRREKRVSRPLIFDSVPRFLICSRQVTSHMGLRAKGGYRSLYEHVHGDSELYRSLEGSPARGVHCTTYPEREREPRYMGVSVRMRRDTWGRAYA